MFLSFKLSYRPWQSLKTIKTCNFELRHRLLNILRHLIQDSGAPAIHLAITAAKAIFLFSVDRLREKRGPSYRQEVFGVAFIDRFAVSIGSQGANGLVSLDTNSLRRSERATGRRREDGAYEKYLCSTYTYLRTIECHMYIHVLRHTRAVSAISAETHSWA